MSFKNLSNITQNMKLTDTQAIVEQGKKAFRAMFPRSANPFKSDRDRNCWQAGYEFAERQWNEMMHRWRMIEGRERHA